MDKIKEILSVIAVVALFLGLMWFGWSIVSLFVDVLSKSDAKVSATVIGAIVTVIVGLTATLYTQKQIKLREIDDSHRAKKVELYSGFLEIVQKLMSGMNEQVSAPPLEENELITFMVKFKTEIILWSSPGVINAFKMFESTSSSNSSIDKLFPAVDDLYREMRKDIGLSNWNLPKNQLVKMYLKDPSELDQAILDASRF